MKRLVPHDRELVTRGQPSLRKSFFISNPLVGLDREAEIQLGSGPDNDRFSFGVKRQTSVNLAHVEQLCVVAGRRLGFQAKWFDGEGPKRPRRHQASLKAGFWFFLAVGAAGVLPFMGRDSWQYQGNQAFGKKCQTDQQPDQGV